MPHSLYITVANTYKMECRAYKKGEPVSIKPCSKHDWLEGSLDDDHSHVLVYWATENHPFACPQACQDYIVAEIQPIRTIYPSHLGDGLSSLADKQDSESNFLISMQELLFNECAEQCEKLNENQPKDAWVFCDISSCCYIVLSKEGAIPYRIEGSREDSSRESNTNLLEMIDKLMRTLEFEDRVLRYNKNHQEYLELIKKAIELESGIPERQYEGLVFAWLLFNTERSETALRYLKSTGDVNDSEDYDVRNVRDARFLLLKEYAERFLEQASNIDDQSQIWSTLNFTMFLLELAVNDETNVEIFNDFMGLYPVINVDEQNGTDLCTVSPIQYSPQFTYAFLCIPANLRYRFSGYLRQLLHEFFHYVPTETRSRRNKLLLRLFAYRVLGSNATVEAVEQLVNFLGYHYRRLGHETLLYQDSMSFITTMRVVLNRVDLPEYLKNQGISLSKHENFPSNPQQIEYLWSYTFFLREIRSDISMIELLNANGPGMEMMGLREYIQLMANEPNWATLSVDEVSIDSVLRFGFMTHWLLDLETDDADLQVGQKDIMIQKVIDEIIDNCSEFSSIQKYKNLRDYLEEYNKEIAFIKSCKKDLLDITLDWKNNDKYLNRIIDDGQGEDRQKSSFWKDFLCLYQASDFERNGYNIDRVQKDFIVKLLLINLPYYKEYYIKQDSHA